jgi:linoleoyl-CoA desaturase
MGAVTSARQRPSFGSGGDFILDTRREVEAYLESGRVRMRAHQKLYAKTFVAFALWAASWGTLIFAHPGVLLGVLALLGLTFATVLIAFCVQHDANHGAYFGTRRANHLMGWTADTFAGFSSYAWRVKHNIAHHTYTNVAGYDDDINQAPFARLTPNQTPKPWYRLQHIYIWPLYSLMVLRWQTGADIAALVRGRIGSSPIKVPRRWSLVGLISGKLIFVSWAIVVPLLVYPWWVVLAGYLVFAGVTSLITATTFQLAHCVEEADFASVEEVTASKRVWAVHEVETTVDFCTGNVPLTWVLGGLNYQIEHHLFPQLPHTHYPRIAAIVRRNAAKHGVRYTAQPSLFAALRSHQRHLRGLGRMGLPVAIEMG